MWIACGFAKNRAIELVEPTMKDLSPALVEKIPGQKSCEISGKPRKEDLTHDSCWCHERRKPLHVAH